MDLVVRGRLRRENGVVGRRAHEQPVRYHADEDGHEEEKTMTLPPTRLYREPGDECAGCEEVIRAWTLRVLSGVEED